MCESKAAALASSAMPKCKWVSHAIKQITYGVREHRESPKRNPIRMNVVQRAGHGK